MTQYKPILKYPGSKWRLAQDIIAMMPEHRSYLEPYFGSGAVLFNKQPSPIETVNDIDNRVYLLFKMVREQPEVIAQLVADTPYCRTEYNQTFDAQPTEPTEIVRQFLVRCWMGFNSPITHRSGWKNDVQGCETAYTVNNWNRLPGWIIDAAKRLKQVQITNEPALDLIKRFNNPKVLIYADPPYVLSTRKSNMYRYEMTDDDHRDLLHVLLQHKGPVILSGYRNQIYDAALQDWHSIDIKSIAQQGVARTETIWANFEPVRQICMF